MEHERLHLFDGFGVELDYAIVNSSTLDTATLAAELLRAAGHTDQYVSGVERGTLALSHRMAMHRVALSTNGSAPSLEPLASAFTNEVRSVNAHLANMGARLMPSAMHPWMNPRIDTALWPHESSEAYATLDRIFDCRTHGWTNLQSSQISVPFYDEREFARLHAAIRLVLPLIPAIAASSPIADGVANGIMDNRVEAYRSKALRLPFIAGRIIPEQLFTTKDYEREVYDRIHADIAPFDTGATLRHRQLNERGAVPRFEYSTIEIRLADVQECAIADMAIAAAIIGVVEALTGEFSANLILQQAWEADPLYTLLLETTRDAESTIVSNAKYLRLMRYPEGNRCRASELWQHLIETVLPASSVDSEQWEAPLHTILSRGTLARRISRAIGNKPNREHIAHVYSTLCDCLERGVMFGN